MPDIAPEANTDGKIRVMLVDDSAVIRGLIGRELEKDPDIVIVASSHNGEAALKALEKAAPDVIILDIEMPIMDGLTALPLIHERCPKAKVLICSTLSVKGADISMKALALGATDCLVKPTSTSEMGGAAEFQTKLLQTVKSLGRHKLKKTVPQYHATHKNDGNITLRPKPPAKLTTALVAVGSSTGGPQALFDVLKHLKGLSVPIVITQHMPATFTKLLAQHIEQNCGLPAHEGAQDMHLEKGHVYVAPGGFHMELQRNEDRSVSISIKDGAPENYCKPSVDPMMRSAVSLYGNRVLGVMLTGMGNDGLNSFKLLADEGGIIIAQDEKTSVVWGMPGAVAHAGLCNTILPLGEIGHEIFKNVMDN